MPDPAVSPSPKPSEGGGTPGAAALAAVVAVFGSLLRARYRAIYHPPRPTEPEEGALAP